MLRSLSICWLILVIAAALPMNAQFAAAPNVSAVPGSSVFLQDLNGDGILDAFVYGTMNFKGQGRVLLGNGDGTFRQGQNFNFGNQLASAVLGDFHGNGKLDLLVAENGCGGPFSLYNGNGDGTFQAPTLIPFQMQGCAIQAVDVNSDHKADLIVATANPDGFAVLLSNGDGTFQPPIFTATTNPYPVIVMGDFNNDRKPDLAVADTNGTEIFLGNGDGTFTLASFINAMSPVAVADFNKNGNQDLLLISSSILAVALGNGDGTFQSPHNVGVAGLAQVVGDFNGDGKSDIAVLGMGELNGTGSTVTLLLGNGDGTFQAPPLASAIVDSNAVSIVVGDLNRDKRLDLVTANGVSSTLTILLGAGDGTFAAAKAFPVATNLSPLALADFNRDGKIDAALVGTTGPYLLLGNGDGTFQSATQVAIFQQALGMAAGQFTQSGSPDLAVTSGAPNNGLYLIVNNGDGTFQAPVQISSNCCLSFLAAADLNGDGKLDLAAINDAQGKTLAIFLGNGNGTFQAEKDLNLAIGNIHYILATDLNGDGKLDLVVAQNQGTQIAVLLGNGDGTFQNPQSYSTLAYPVAIAAGDLNGNDRQDIAVSTPLGTVVLAGNGDGTLQPAQLVDRLQQGSPTAITIGDFNGDGRADIALGVGSTRQSGCQVRVLTNAGNGKFKPVNYNAACVMGVGLADLNGDGKPDIVGSSSFAVLLNTSALVFSSRTIGFSPQVLNTTSAPKTITLTNQGTANWNITSVSASGDFAVKSTTCLPSLPAGHNCSIVTTFTPTAGGKRLGAITLVDSAPGSPQIVSLSGSGSIASVQPTSVNFGSVPVNTMSQPKPVTLKNVSNTTTLNISSITLGGKNPADFNQTNNCGSSLGPQQSCTVNVTFKPAVVGARSGILQINDDAAGSPQKVSLAGTGT
ncbi:MAG TPA: FG-GAP-like repeat-containing protein [Terriglobales bacterium]|nr:FG-GAP-like repeat-containing protein [Terriglobales bacterium]